MDIVIFCISKLVVSFFFFAHTVFTFFVSFFFTQYSARAPATWTRFKSDSITIKVERSQPRQIPPRWLELIGNVKSNAPLILAIYHRRHSVIRRSQLNKLLTKLINFFRMLVIQLLRQASTLFMILLHQNMFSPLASFSYRWSFGKFHSYQRFWICKHKALLFCSDIKLFLQTASLLVFLFSFFRFFLLLFFIFFLTSPFFLNTANNGDRDYCIVISWNNLHYCFIQQWSCVKGKKNHILHLDRV